MEIPEFQRTFDELGHVPSHTIGVTRAGQAVTTISDHAHEFFATSSENVAMRLKGRDVVRSETTIYVLVIVASLGAMIAMHRGRQTHAGCTDCCHGAGPADRSATDDPPPNEAPADELTSLERHHAGERGVGRFRDR